MPTTRNTNLTGNAVVRRGGAGQQSRGIDVRSNVVWTGGGFREPPIPPIVPEGSEPRIGNLNQNEVVRT